MKNIVLVLLSIMSIWSYAQTPYSGNIDGKCSHQKAYSNVNTVHAQGLDITQVSDKYDMNFIHLDLLVSSATTYVEGSARMDATILSPTLDTIYLELNSSLILDSMLYNGDLVTPTFVDSEIFLLIDELQQGDAFSVITYYHGSSSSGGFFSGITTDYNSTYGKSVTWTLSEPFSARDWFPVRQSLEDKIDSVYQDYTCIDTEMVGTNGLLTDVVDNGDGTKTYLWKTNYPIAYYLMSFAVSEYMDYSIYAHPEEIAPDSILIQNFIYNDASCFNYNQSNIDLSDEIMEVFSEKFGLYPFHEEKYGNCLTELGGGMEHQTMTTIGGFSFGLNAHEMGHQWYGDNITCATWSDIFINEGFASYSEYVAAQYIVSQASANSWMNAAHSYIVSDNGGSVYVPEDEVYYGNESRIFNGRLTYKKGAAIIHQIRYLVDNDELFFQAMQNYTDEYTDSIATGIDFKNSIEASTGLELDSYFNQWYFGEGYPTYSIEYSYNSDGMFIAVSQTTSASTPFFDIPLEVKLHLGAGEDTTFRIPITGNITYFQTAISNDIILMEMDPDNWIINKSSGISVGTRELQNEMEFVVGPNPTTGYLHLHFSNNDQKDIVITDIYGREVRHMTLNSTSIIDISELSEGYYFIKAIDGKSSVTRKILKQ